MKSLPNVDPDISAVGETLRISEDAILIDNNALASQLVARLYEVRGFVGNVVCVVLETIV